MRKEICIKNKVSELEKVAQFIEEIGEELGLSMELQMNLNLVMEEMVTDPTAKEDNDLSVNPAERELGGMGIFIVKNIMNKVTYQRLEGKNLLTMTKGITDDK